MATANYGTDGLALEHPFFFFWFPHFWSEMGPAISRHGIFFAHVLGGDQVERSPSLCGFASSRAAHPWRVRVPLQCCMDVALCLEASKNIWSVKKKLVVFIIWGLSYFQDPFEPASIMECHKVFFHCSHVPTRAAALSIKTGHGHRELTGAHHFRPWILEGNFLKWRFRKWAEWKLGCALLGVAWIDI